MDDKNCERGKICKGKALAIWGAEKPWCSECLVDDERCGDCGKKFSEIPDHVEGMLPPLPNLPWQKPKICWICKQLSYNSYQDLKRKGVI